MTGCVAVATKRQQVNALGGLALVWTAFIRTPNERVSPSRTAVGVKDEKSAYLGDVESELLVGQTARPRGSLRRGGMEGPQTAVVLSRRGKEVTRTVVVARDVLGVATDRRRGDPRQVRRRVMRRERRDQLAGRRRIDSYEKKRVKGLGLEHRE